MSMIWIDTDTRQPVSEADIRAAHPLTVFPQPFAPPDGYEAVIDAEAPAFDPLTHALQWGEPVRDEAGTWRRAVAVQALPEDVAAANVEAARLARVPASVSRAQGKLALIQAGLWPQVQAFVAGIEDATQRALAEVALNDTTEWRRASTFLAQCAQALGLSERQLDDLFTAAAEVQL